VSDNGLGIINDFYDAGAVSVQVYSNDFRYVKVPMYYSRTLYVTVPTDVALITKVVQCILKCGFNEVTTDEDPHRWKLCWTEGKFRGRDWEHRETLPWWFWLTPKCARCGEWRSERMSGCSYVRGRKTYHLCKACNKLSYKVNTLDSEQFKAFIKGDLPVEEPATKEPVSD